MKCNVKKILGAWSDQLSILIFVGVITNFEDVDGFSVGVPPLRSVCISMNPQHHDYVSQGSEPPFEVSVNKNEVYGGDTVDFVLKSMEADKKTKFIGFYVQARDDKDSPIGTFTPNKDTKVHSCGGIRANAAHHASGNVKKENVTISWTAPREFQGEVVFTATAVKDFVTYWVYMQTDPVMVKTADVQRILTMPSLPSTPSSGIFRRPFSQNSLNQQPLSLVQPGAGIRMIFQTLQTTANQLGSLLIPPRFRPNNNDNRPSSSGTRSRLSSSSSLSSSNQFNS